MYAVELTEDFKHWLFNLRDLVARARIVARLRHASMGQLGDCSPSAAASAKCVSTWVRAIACISYAADASSS
jgi:hypothetical protein